MQLKSKSQQYIDKRLRKKKLLLHLLGHISQAYLLNKLLSKQDRGSFAR